MLARIVELQNRHLTKVRNELQFKHHTILGSSCSYRAKTTSIQRQLSNAEKALSTCTNNNQKKKKRKKVAKLRKELQELLGDCVIHARETNELCKVIVGEEHWATHLTSRLCADISALTNNAVVVPLD